jgi:predicted chitinase
MAAVPPSKNTAKIVEEFIRYAQQHLGTVSGLINTVSIFPSVPSPITLPSIVNWTGYFIPPPPPSIGVDSLGQLELNEVEEEELKEQIQQEKERVIDNLNEANEILSSGILSNQLDEDILQTHIANLEETIENPDIINETLRELKIQKNQTTVEGYSIYGNIAPTPNPTITFNTSNSDIQSIFVGDTEPKPVIKKLPQSQNLKLMEAALIKIGVTNTEMIKAVKANSLKESGGQVVVEDLAGYGRTANSRIREIFGDRVAKYTEDQLTQLKKNTPLFTDAIYGVSSGKVGKGLGNTAAGDGYKYRGRGFIQLTGKANYTAASLALYKDTRLVKNPDLALQPQIAADTTAWYIKTGIPYMSKLTGISAVAPTQGNANVLVTSMIAGTAIKRGGKGFLATEALVKVDTYSLQV